MESEMKKNHSVLFCFLLLMLAAVLPAVAQDAPGDFAAANKLYRDGNFKEAAVGYSQIMSRGVVSESLFYNLGNAYVKSGELGRAVLAYERALKQNPRDPEVRANLDYTRSCLEDKTEDNTLVALLEKLSPARWISWRENVWAFCILYWSGTILALAGYGIRRRWRGLLAGGLLLLGLSCLLGTALFFRSPLWASPRAIVLAKDVEVRYGPVLAESTAFTLHEGSKVRILRSAEDWNQIAFAKGKVGWIPAEAAEKI